MLMSWIILKSDTVGLIKTQIPIVCHLQGTDKGGNKYTKRYQYFFFLISW